MRFERALRVGQFGVMAVCLGVPLLMFGLGARSAAIDNRLPTPRPAISGTKLLDTTVTAEFDQFLADGFPFRELAVDWNAQLADALGDSSNSDVEIGRDGWLFYADTRTQRCIDNDEKTRLAAALDRVDRVMDAVGARITHVIAPDKMSIFSDKVATEPTCVLEGAEALATLDTGATIVTTWAETRAVAVEDSTAYRRLDTHWTSVGAVPTASALVDGISPGLWDADALQVASVSDTQGDLSFVLGRPDTESETILATAQPSDWPNAVAEPTVLLHDSFGERLVPLVAPYFRDLVIFRGVSPRDTGVQSLLAESDHIIREQVQREFYYDVVLSDLAAQFVVAFADEFDGFDIDVVCADLCTITSARTLAATDASDSYAIASLRAGVADAEIVVGGVVHQLTAAEPSLGVFLARTGSPTVTGDLDRVEWTGRSVTP